MRLKMLPGLWGNIPVAMMEGCGVNLGRGKKLIKSLSRLISGVV
jgi:hypothetical protein